jgi:hypothetical protein
MAGGGAVKKLTKAQRRELKRAMLYGCYTGGLVGYATYKKLHKRGYLAWQDVTTEHPSGRIIHWSPRLVLTDKGKRALEAQP